MPFPRAIAFLAMMCSGLLATGAKAGAAAAPSARPLSMFDRLLAQIGGIENYMALEITGVAAVGVWAMWQWRERLSEKGDELHEGDPRERDLPFEARVAARLRELNDERP